jgi:MSHA pilin protein MshA
MNNQGGFTLIELVMVIVILGILAASAIPSFVDVSGDAEQAAVDGMAGALGSASAINYAVRSMGNGDGAAVANCTDVEAALEGGNNVAADGVAGDTDYSITDNALTVAGGPETCVLTHVASGLTANFVGHPIN